MKPTQNTTVRSGNTAAASLPRRFRVTLVGGSGAVVTEGLEGLLRRRLLALSTFMAAAIALMVISDLISVPVGYVFRTYSEIMVYNRLWLCLIAINGTSAWFLWCRPPRSMFGLRLIECLNVGPLVVLLLMGGLAPEAYDLMASGASESPRVSSAFVYRYTSTGGLMWVFAILGYGTLIPNTLRRAAIVTGVMALSPIFSFLVYALWVHPLAPAVIGQVVLGLTTSNIIAVALVLVTTSRIEVLRQQAAEARKLGQYVLKEKLGAGGMGEVHRAEHALLRRPCAIKTIRPERAGDSETVHRFEREVQTTATLTHPNTVQVFDYGHAEDGTFYYVMEFLPGMTLEELVRQTGPLPPRRAVHFLKQVCGALGEAHRRGLTHRDIKPGNIMVCERGGIHDVAKVLDFGMVMLPKEEAGGGALTREGVFAGTPAYMSPEQAGGVEGIDPRSDLYSVGALAYFLLTGKPPFAEGSAVKMMAAHMYEIPGPLPAAVPAELAEVVMRCLAKTPADRWPDAPSLASALASSVSAVWTGDDARRAWEHAKF